MYLGTFEFAQGSNIAGRVVLTNQSDYRGVVTADAVRFGGGVGQTVFDITTRFAPIYPVYLRDGEGKVIKEAHGLSATAFAQGAHSLAVGDVDGDGCDEITYGSAAINHDGSLLYSTGLGHGDALHLSDLDPDRPGLEVFMVHEERPYGSDYRDARTGEILYRTLDRDDTGRGVAADIDGHHRGFEMWSLDRREVRDCHGKVIADDPSRSISKQTFLLSVPRSRQLR